MTLTIRLLRCLFYPPLSQVVKYNRLDIFSSFPEVDPFTMNYVLIQRERFSIE